MTKRRKEFDKAVDKNKSYSIDEAVKILKQAVKPKFD